MKRAFELRGFDWHADCTCDLDRRCWIVKDLTNINLCLYNGCMELVEIEPRLFTLRNLVGSVYFDKSTAICRVPESYSIITVNLLLRRHRCIERLEFSSELIASKHFDFVLESLADNDGVTKFGIHNLHGEYLNEVFDAASRLGNLRELCLVDTVLRRDVANTFKRVLRYNPWIECVELIRNSVEGNDEFFLTTLTMLPKLRKFVYDNNSVYEDGIYHLATLMERDTCLLEELRLSRCLQEESAGVRFFEALGENSTLKVLQLKACLLSNEAIDNLAVALKKNRRLERLEVIYSRMEGDWIAPIAEALRLHNRTLKRLDLEATNVWPERCVLLLEAMSNNTSLVEVNLGYLCGIDEVLETIVERGLQDRIRIGVVGTVMGHALCDLRAVNLLSTITNLTVNYSGISVVSAYSKLLFHFAAHSTALKVFKVNLLPLVYKETCDSITEFLRATTTVETFHFKSLMSNLTMVDSVMMAMAENRSVVDWSCADCVIYPQSLPVLLHMLRTNKTLAYLEMSAYLTAEDYGQIASAMSKSILRLAMQNAYEDFGVGEVLRQNLLRMNRAVEFVTNPEDFVECECVRDFEDVLDTASFARHFAQAHPQDNSRLPSMLARAKRSIKGRFFEFSGICRDNVPLCESSGKPILNYECWQHVFSFLTLNNVVW
ncbi:uncharacterized protein ISCGN_005823 [Ixodes scapularis]